MDIAALLYMKKIKFTLAQKSLSDQILAALSKYAKTQLILTVIIAGVSWVLLSYLNIRFALLLAIFTGAASIIPVLGITLAAITVAIIAMFDGVRFLPNSPPLVEGLLVLLMYGVLNIALDYFLSPYLTGKMVHIHPVLLLLGVIVGTVVFGVLGALLAVPVILVVKTVIDYYNNHSRTS